MAEYIAFYHTDHTNHNVRNWPLTIPWNTVFYSSTGELKQNVEFSAGVMQDLRQHAKAIIYYRFNLTPTFQRVNDEFLEPEDIIGNEEFNETDGVIDPVNSGLLDDMTEGLLTAIGGTNPTPVSSGQVITVDKINEITAKLKAANNYSNIAPLHQNVGYNRYSDLYVNHINSHSNTYRGRGHRHHSNHYNNGGNMYNNYLKQHINSSYTNSGAYYPPVYTNTL